MLMTLMLISVLNGMKSVKLVTCHKTFMLSQSQNFNK